MKKKLSLMLCLCFTVLAMTACGTDPTTVDYYGTSYDTLQQDAEGWVNALVNATEEDLEYTKTYSGMSELVIKLIEGWQTTVPDLGEYQGLGELEITKANGTVTAEQLVEFSVREASITYVYEYDYADEQLEMTDVTVDLVYTLGEKMQKAAMNTIMGLGTVFSVLILISLIIMCFRIIPYMTERKKTKAITSASETVAETSAVTEESAVLTDDLELVAVISAAIAATTGTSTDSFVVRSIHRR